MPCFIWVKANTIYEKALLSMSDAVEVYCVSRGDRITILEACMDRYSLSHTNTVFTCCLGMVARVTQ